MARIRTIKPDFFTDEGLAELPPLVRLLFIGLWTEADGDGRLEDRPKYLKVKLLPYDKADLPMMLKSLNGFIQQYEIDGKRYIQIKNFRKHQRITGREAETDSVIPEPPENAINSIAETPGKQWGNNSETADVQEGKGMEGNGREWKGKECRGKQQVRSASSRTQPPDEEWLESLKGNPAYEGIDIRKVLGKMVAWCGVKGKKPTRARLVNWLNREDRSIGSGNQKEMTRDEIEKMVERAHDTG